MLQTSTKKYKTRHDYVGKVIHLYFTRDWDLNHTTKWYMHKSESISENETHKILFDFEIQTQSPNPGEC